ncbi:ABCC3 [Bugula neritina]|uniref:ABCC3 n=1 Tax=Bugula neritina TaxID=10212 RepID=A0A7J7JFJ6_BUGNE|nr:ABCC3 [Bugula neritina]
MVQSAKGCIKIDEVDISTLGLHDLRCRLTILPQDPVLFSGSFRDNLDPFGSYTDSRLWEVLSQCQLKEYVSHQPGQLTAECGEGGKNLSRTQASCLPMYDIQLLVLIG